MSDIIQSNIIMEFFIKNPNRDIKHPEIVDWATEEYKKRTGKVFRDPDRAIRKLSQLGYLIKVKKGVYKYDPDFIQHRELEDFTTKQKKQILERDGYKCVRCGRGIKEGVELHVDHIISKDQGGRAIIENGETLCSQHNFVKKNLKQTETGKKMFIRFYELAKVENNKEMMEFFAAILKVYEDYNINCHIKWNK